MKRAPIWRSWRIEDKAGKNRSPTNINIWNIYSIMVIINDIWNRKEESG